MDERQRKTPAEEYVVERVRKLEKELDEKNDFINLLTSLGKEKNEKLEEDERLIREICSHLQKVEGKNPEDYGYSLYVFKFIDKDRQLIEELEKHIK